MGSPNPPFGKTTKPPIEPQEDLNFFSRSKPVVVNPFPGQLPSSTGRTNFNPKDYSDVQNAQWDSDPTALKRLDDNGQSVGDVIKNSAVQFGANFISSIGQGLANTWDLASNYKTAKGILTGSNDDFNSHLLGLSTTDMQGWANGIAERYNIKGGDDFNPLNGAWWAKQIASTGTSFGMAAEALGETAGIEALTGGAGTGVALARLGRLVGGLVKGTEGVEAVKEGMSIAKGLRSAATVYGVMSRASESRMEAMQTYQQSVDDLKQQKNSDGSPKFTDKQIEQYASEGARRDYAYNMAMLPLDILSFKMMTFNPISGGGEGAIEKGLEHLAGKFGESAVGKAAGWTTAKVLGTLPEGIEEGWQQWGQDEGQHYARVLGGLDDGSTYGQRLGKEVESDNFWNNFSGGIIGAPLTGGAMAVLDNTLHGKAKARQAEYYKDYIQNVAKMDNETANKIKAYEDAGNNKAAQVLRQQFFADKALGALHLDASTGKDQAFDALHTFISGTLDELNQGKTDALTDLGVNKITPEAIEENKKMFKGYLEDANTLKDIYNNVQDKYVANFVPTIVNQHFAIHKLGEAKNEVEQEIAKLKTGLYQHDQLSSVGKELYDTEYKMKGLIAEQDRLNRQLKQSNVSDEKENIEKVIKENNERLTQVAQRVKDINSDDSYKSEDKNKDAEIIESAITNKDYQQAMVNLEGINNSLSLGRKNLMLWNKPAFQAKMKKQAVENARTQGQVDTAISNPKNTQQNANVPNTPTNPAVNTTGGTNTQTEQEAALQRLAEEKKTTLAAKEAGNPQIQTEADTEGDSLTQFDKQQYANIGEAVNTSTAIGNNNNNSNNGGDEFGQEGVEPELQFAPKAVDFDKSPQEAKDKIKSGVGNILDRLGEDSSFEDLVRHSVKVQGADKTDEMYNALKYGWEANGKPAVDYDAVYAKVFGNPFDEIKAGFSQLVFQTEKELKNATKEIAQVTEAHQLPPTVFNSDNQPIYIYKGKAVTSENQPKLAFLSRMSDLILNTTDEGVEVDQEYSENDLNAGEYVNSLPLLDPDQFREGTQLTIKIPTNYNDMLVPIYNADGTKGKAMTFGKWVAENNIEKDSQEYKDKIPMVIHQKGKENEKGVALVHDIGWYHPTRFNAESKDEMQEAIASTRAIREEVLGNDGSTEGSITGKRETTFAPFKLPEGTPIITLREANPQTQLGVVLNSTDVNNVYTAKGEKGRFVNNNRELINVKPYNFVGQILDIRRFGKKGDKETHVASPVFRQKIDAEAKNSVKSAIRVYANRKATLSTQLEAFHKQVLATMGLDIKDTRGLQKYLEHFIKIQNVDKADTNAKAETQMASSLDTGTPFITFLQGGNIAFGQAGMRVSSQYGSYFINPNIANNTKDATQAFDKEIIIDGNRYPDFLSWYETNLDINNFEANKPIVTIDAQGNSRVASPSYNDYLLDRLKTDIKSYNIDTKENPKYVTNAQPVITYDTNKRLQQSEPSRKNEVTTTAISSDNNKNAGIDSTGTKTQTNNSQQEQQINNNINTNQNGKEEEKENVLNQQDVEAQLREAEKLARELLGKDFGTTAKGLQFAPTPINDKQTEVIQKSIDRVAGLTVAQQEHIIDFLYNNIIPTIEKNGGSVDYKQCSKEVERLFNETINPRKSRIEETIPRFEDMLAKNPALEETGLPNIISDFKFTLGKMNAIQSNLDLIKDLAFKKVLKYTNIKVDRIVREEDSRPENEEDEDRPNTGEEEGSGRDVDFWTDMLQESPENKLNKAMRRFFGQIQKIDTEGNPINGYLDLASYENADNIVRKLMTTLADVPSDFDTMLTKLEQMKATTPWMQQVIDKLKGADKEKRNGFVTVMSNTSLRSKFAMISFNQKNQTWSTRIWDTNLSGVSDAVKSEWNANFFGDKDNLTLVKDGNYVLNKDMAKHLIHTFESWRGKGLKAVPQNLVEPLWTGIISRVNTNKPQTFVPSGQLASYLKDNIGETGRVSFKLKGHEFQISKGESNTYKIEYLNTSSATEESVGGWLKPFGIRLTPQTLKALKIDGLYHNYAQRKWDDLFDDNAQTNGLFGILYNKLKALVLQEEVDFTEHGDNPLDNGVIKSLATLEGRYNDTATPFGYRDNGKQYFALTAPKFMTDRARELKAEDGILLQQLNQISFSQPSMVLRLLQDKDFRAKFGVYHLGANAIKQLGKAIYRDNGITALSDTDHEMTKLTFFWDRTQGELNQTYPDTNIPMKIATMFGLTNSDKSTMMATTTAVLDLETAHLSGGISDDVVKVLYEQLVKPELQRMIQFHKNGAETNIKDYDNGAKLFNFLPSLNTLEYSPGLKLIDAIAKEPNSPNFNLQSLEGNKDLRGAINNEIKNYVSTLVNEKLKSWEESGLIDRSVNENGEMETNLHFFDNKYINKFRGNDEEKATMAAADYVINSLVSNANSFMLFAGDPALFYKKDKLTDSKDYINVVKDTFVNVGKRLAYLIAPGTAMANADKEEYIQLFLKDRKGNKANNLLYLQRLLGEAEAKSYENIDAADAQEYTTWKEHLHVLELMGKTPDIIMDISPQEIRDARELLASGVNKKDLSEKQLKLIKKVFQPIKPVFAGQIYNKEQDVMRSMYIKSSSFPLLPYFTAGLEIDKLRQVMEKTEETSQKYVRASYQTANKVGAISTPLDIWDKNGRWGLHDDSAEDKEFINNLLPNEESWGSALVLPRKYFKIQQDVPFKSGKNTEDKQTLGTQLMKLLFGDDIMKISKENGFNYNGEVLSGAELHTKFNDLHIRLLREKRNQLFNELGLDDSGRAINKRQTQLKLQKLLKDEATNRGYPLQDIEGLELDNNGDFKLPLWASNNSNRYEAMLNSIVSNRMVKMKMPGNSYVVGSEEGIKTQVIEGEVPTHLKNKIVFTDKWQGELKSSYTKDGKLEKSQVLVASKFRDNEGNLIDLFTKKDGKYVYVNETPSGFALNNDMFDKELLDLMVFRIPTSGLQSGSSVEIVGFLPAENADLMIAPKNFTKQMGQDFDIDKLNSYQLWHYMDENGKFKIVDEAYKQKILASVDTNKEEREANLPDFLKEAYDLFDMDIPLDQRDINDDKRLKHIASKLDEKLMQNEMVKIYHSIYSNPSDEVQKKIVKTLNTDFAEDEAKYIESLQSGKDSKYWTPLSDEYQKQKVFLGASGKIGTGAYSLDVVFHSLVQQAKNTGRPMELMDAEGHSKTWRFGGNKYTSNAKLGESNTKDGGRSISDVLSERQNIAVDNEKLQIMGKVNLNDMTLDIDKVFNLMGIDKGEDGHSIPFLFLSQPIVKDFVKLMKNANSNMAEFEANKEEKIIDQLIHKYDSENTIDKYSTEEEYWDAMSDLMTNTNFANDIKAKPEEINGALQSAVLRRFLEMREYGIAIRKVQTTLNFKSNSLGKSFFDVIEKRNALNDLAINNLVKGATGLVGDYRKRMEVLDPTDPKGQRILPEILEQGYIDMGDYVVKPDTTIGAFNIHAVSTAYNTWKPYLPYDAAMVQKAFDELLPIIGSGDNMGVSKRVELKQEIFKGIKKYMNASKITGVIGSEDNPNNERERLYIDSNDNVSLANYIKQLMQTPDNNVIDTFIKTNKLLNRFEFDVQKNGQPSLIKYNNAAGEEFDEQYLYEAIAGLLTARDKEGKRISLPTIGNKSYTLDTLAQDLIAYSYLGNSTQEAIQFIKYVPMAYLNSVGYSRIMNAANKQFDTNQNILGTKVGNENTPQLVSEFTMQYAQHNPERVKSPYKNAKVLMSSIVDGDSRKLAELTKFKLKPEEINTNGTPTFISVYDSSIQKGEKKFRLFWFDGTQYTRIPVLGTFGMDEYQPGRNRETGEGWGQSLINGRVRVIANPQQQINVAEQSINEKDVFNVKSGDVTTVLNNIAKGQHGDASILAKELSKYTSQSPLKIVYSDTSPDINIPFLGLYNRHTNVITISPTQNANKSSIEVARTILEEVTHGLTSNKIDQWISSDKNGIVTVKHDAPAYVTSLVRLYNDVRGQADQTILKGVIDKWNNRQQLTQDEIDKYYGLKDIYEFMGNGISRPAFQSELNNYKSPSGQTFLERFKEIISNILSKIGIDVKKDHALEAAFNSIFDFIDKTNTTEDENTGAGMYEDSINGDFDEDKYWDGLPPPEFPEHQDGETEEQWSPFPTKSLDIKDENCL